MEIQDRIYQENLISKYLIHLSQIIDKVREYNMIIDYNQADGHEQSVYDDIKNTEYSFNSSIRDLYLIILNYLEFVGSIELLNFFKQDLKHIFEQDYKGIIEESIEDEGLVYYYSPDLDNIRKFLKPFKAFDLELNKNIGLVYLESILSHTAYIINQTKSKPKKEADVYNAVKHVIESTFPEYYGLTESFYKQAKHYKPDILIPSISTAIEYKYAKDKERLTKTIEEIKIDVVGYSNHHIYKIFYAVFYVAPNVITKQRFDVIWKDYNFPNNWKPIFVEGN